MVLEIECVLVTEDEPVDFLPLFESLFSSSSAFFGSEPIFACSAGQIPYQSFRILNQTKARGEEKDKDNRTRCFVQKQGGGALQKQEKTRTVLLSSVNLQVCNCEDKLKAERKHVKRESKKSKN